MTATDSDAAVAPGDSVALSTQPLPPPPPQLGRRSPLQVARRGWRVLTSMRTALLLLVLSFVVLFCWMLLLALPAVPVVLMLVRLWHAGHAGLGGMFWLGTIGGLGAVALLLWAVLTYLLLVGNLLTFVQAYSLYFVGGRYPLVGQYLEPEAAPQLGFRDPPDIA